MNRTTKIKITELNPHVICVLCGGYFINATTIVECLHSFCRTCITHYLETSKYCPVCDVMVHKTRPLEYIRSDKTLQDLVYKLVPCLYKNEMKRRREYYAANDSSGVVHPPSEDRGDEFHDRIIYTEDEKISLSLELCAEGIPFKTPATIHGHNGPENIKIKDVRYLHCPAAFSVGNLKKFIRMKFDLKQKYEIDIFQSAEPLHDYYTLMDIAYIYTWTRRAPLRLYYTVYQRKIPPKGPDPLKCVNPKTIDTNPSAGQNITNITDDSSDKCSVKKRKLPDGPSDISPDFNLDKSDPPSQESGKDGNIPRKRPKKNAVVDSAVHEAMSESEEQLAKLTLNSSMEILKQHGESKGKINDDGNSCDNLASKPESSVACEDSTKPVTVNTEETNVDRNVNNENEQVSPASIQLSLFQPLNANDEKKTVDETVYEFPSEQSTTVPSLMKPKGKPGRKKKNPDSETNMPHLAENKSSNVIPMLTEDAKKSKQKKTAVVKFIDKTSSGAVQGDASIKQPNSVANDAGIKVEKVKRKYVRKAPRIPKEKSKETTLTKHPMKPKCMKTVNTDSNASEETRVDHMDYGHIKASHESSFGIPSSIYEYGMYISDTNKDGFANGRTLLSGDCSNDNVRKPDMLTDPGIVNQPSAVLEPTTPLYGQTPKVTELGQVLPNSPSPDFAENNVPKDGAAIMRDVNTGVDKGAILNVSEGMYNVYEMNHSKVKSLAPLPVVSNSNGVKSNGLGDVISSNSSVFVNGAARNMTGAVQSCPANGHSVSTVPAVTSNTGVAMDMYPRFSCASSTAALNNGYPQMEQGADQPLDLTSPHQREEYTKGKIFKTKMLKKSLPKTESPGKQGDKGIHGYTNGIRSPPWI